MHKKTGIGRSYQRAYKKSWTGRRMSRHLKSTFTEMTLLQQLFMPGKEEVRSKLFAFRTFHKGNRKQRKTKNASGSTRKRKIPSSLATRDKGCYSV